MKQLTRIGSTMALGAMLALGTACGGHDDAGSVGDSAALATNPAVLDSAAGMTAMPGTAAGDLATLSEPNVMSMVGLSNAADRRVGTYSGGMRRRLDLATALVHAPRVLFLDEPTTGLDPASRAAIWDEVRKLNQEGTTVFLTTQYLEEADQLCDRLAIIDAGLIVAEGTPSELKADLRRRRGLTQDPTLDDVFLEATGRTREREAGEVQEVQA